MHSFVAYNSYLLTQSDRKQVLSLKLRYKIEMYVEGCIFTYNIYYQNTTLKQYIYRFNQKNHD